MAGQSILTPEEKMKRFNPRPAVAALCAAAMLAPVAASAQPWSYGGWARDASGRPYGASDWRGESSSPRSREDERAGEVTAEHFAADDADVVLGQGGIEVKSTPDSAPDSGDRLVYEAAMIDRFVLAGYDTQLAPDRIGQTAELRIIRDVATPAEVKKSPVSGSTAVSVSNRGTAYGMALNVDLTKPRGALMSTRMELRIRDKETGRVLWESRAQTWSYADDDGVLDDGAIANRLSAALMEGFPHSEA